jgi:repressor LexA
VTRPATDRQLEVHATMIRYQLENGMPPTLRELGELCGIASTNGVRDHLLALKKRGLVRQHRGRAWLAVQPEPQGTTNQ